MKITALFLILVLSTLGTLKAQPVLTAATHRPQIGDNPQRQPLSPDTLYPGPSGSNVTWNFSQLQPQPFSDSVEVISTIPLPPWNYNLAFNVANAPGIKIDYYVSDNDSLAYAGRDYSISDFDPVAFFNTELLLRFPMQYGDAFEDSYSGNHLTIAGPTNFTGVVHVEADAFGTLVLPGGTYPNILRIHHRDTLVVFSVPYVFDTWYFYAANYRYPLLMIGADTYWRGNYVETYYPEAIITEAPGPQTARQLQIYPNPFNAALTLSAPVPGELRIMGIDGKEYFKDVFKQGFLEKKILIEGLPTGLYVASYTHAGGTWHQRLVQQ
jgi:hypothetical protein